MDALELLTEQHTEIRDLFLRLDRAQGDARHALFLKLASALTVHAHLEEEQFYLALRRAETADFLSESTEEHAHVKALISQLAKLESSSRLFRTLLIDLRASVDAHVSEEQAVLFPKAKRLLGVEGLAALGESMEERMLELERPDGIQVFESPVHLPV